MSLAIFYHSEISAVNSHKNAEVCCLIKSFFTIFFTVTLFNYTLPGE